MHHLNLGGFLFEIAAITIIAAMALTFFTDAATSALQLARAARRRSAAIRVADPELSAH